MADAFDPYYTWLGVPPAEQPADHYRMLGVSRFEQNQDVISNAADARMVYVRTFQSSQKSAISQKILNELTVAKICLLDAQKKAEYDRQLKAKWDMIEAAKHPAPVQPVMPESVPISNWAILDEEMPLALQPMPAPQFNRGVGNYSGSMSQPVPARANAPEFYNPNVRPAANPGTQKKGQPTWLLPALIGSGVAIIGLVIIAAAVVIASMGSKPQVAQNVPATNNSINSASAAAKVTPANNVLPTSNVSRPPLPPTKINTPPTKTSTVPPANGKVVQRPPVSPSAVPASPPTNVVTPQSPVATDKPLTNEKNDSQTGVPNASGSSARIAWKPKQNIPIVIQKTSTGWAQFFAGRPQFQMTQKQRTDEFIELFCTGANRTYRLYADRAEFKAGGALWRKEFDGSWIDDAVPVDLASVSPNFPGAPPNFPGGPPNIPGGPPSMRRPGGPSSMMPNRPTMMPVGPTVKYTPKSQGYCVRLNGAQTIEFANPNELASAVEPRTYEGWFRMLDDQPQGLLFGTFLPNSKSGGFRFGLRQGSQTFIDLYRDAGNRSSVSSGGPSFSKVWVHFAASMNWPSDFHFFANGRQILQSKGFPTPASPGLGFWLGAVPNSPTGDNSSLAPNMEVAAFRVSRGMLYSSTFTPPLELIVDVNTLAMLDFSAGKGTMLTDRSNKGHVGNIQGGLWVPFRSE